MAWQKTDVFYLRNSLKVSMIELCESRIRLEVKMKQKTKQWKRAVSLALSFLMMLTLLPADMPVVNAAEETLVNIAGEADVSIQGNETGNPKAHINDGNRESIAGLYGGSISGFSGGEAPYDKPWIRLDFSEDKENIKKFTVVTLKADSVDQADWYQYACTVYGKSSAEESYRELANGTLRRAATAEDSILEFDLSENPVTLNSVVVSLGVPDGGKDCWPILNEVEIYQGQTVEPGPQPDPGPEPEPGPTEGLENITEGCTITPPSSQNIHPVEHMYDGNRNTMWVNNGGDWPCTLEFALPAANTKCVKKVVLQFENVSGRSMDVNLRYALNGITSDLIPVDGSAKTAALDEGYTFEFETPQAMSHLYVTLDNPLTDGQPGLFWPAIAEAEIYIDNGAEEEVVLENIAATRKSRVTLEDSVNTTENQNAVTDNDSATAAPLRTEDGRGTDPFVEVSFGCNQKMRQFVLEMAEDSSGAEYTYTIYGKKKNDTEYTQVTSGTIGTAAENKRAEILVSDLGINAKEVEYESVKAVFAVANSAIPQLAEFQVWANQASIAEADNENIVWGTTAIRSNCNQDTVGRVVDGNTNNTWTADRYPCYVDIELGGLYDLSEVQVYTPEAGYSQYSLYYSSDGQNYTKFGEKDTKESCPASGEVWDASGAQASSVRILMEYHSENAKAVLNEVRVMGTRVGEASEAPFTAPVDFADSAYNVEIAPQDTIDAVKGIVERNLGAQYVDWFEFSLGAEEDYDYFELEDTANGKVRITGNDGVSMATGLNHYLKYYCNVSITQVGNQVSMPAAAPAVGTKVHKECKVPVRYAYNYCTMSYSMPFWGEDEWQKELDWLALNGVNTVLDITGQEEVWRRFLDEIGYSHEEIKDYLAGPAFYAWAYMANLSGWGGPVHDSWFTDRVELARKNQLTMRKLGMQPILQGYSGMVPVDIAEKATAPGYTVGSSDVIPQGSWCGFQRPYMLRTTSQTYKNYAQLFYQCQEQVYGNMSHYYATDPFHEGGNTGGMSPADVSANVMEQMLAKDPKAVWVIQAWQGNPSAALMTGLGSNKEHALVLDLYAEKDTHWSDPNYAGGKEFQNTPWVYCMLNNFGGRMGLHGHMDNLVSGVVTAANTAQKLTGIGITPEASQNNPVLYDLLFETVWCDDASAPLQEIDTAAWLKSYVTRRYGAESESAYQAMLILEDTVYKAALNMNGQGAPESYLNARPATTINAASSWGNSVIGYDMEKLEEAAELLLEDYDTLKDSDGYLYDLADVLKQVLSNTAQKYHRAMVAALNARDLAAFTEASDKFLGLADKVEEVLSTRKEFLLGTWTGQAEALAEGTDDFTEDLYRLNAKAIVTTWGTYGNTEGGGLRDYSNRQWAGLTKDFYRQRWQMWIDYQKEALAGNSPEAINWFEFEWAWVRDHKSYSAQPSGEDLGVLGREILADYSVTEKTAIASPKLLATAPSVGGTPKDVTAEGYHEQANEITFGDGVVRAEGSEDRKFVADGGHDAFMGRYELSNPVDGSDAFDISGSRPFVTSFWIKLDEGTGNGTYSIIGKMDYQYGIQAKRNGGNDYIQMFANAGGGWPTYVSATTDLTDWTYVTALYDGHKFWLSVGTDEDSMALQASGGQSSTDFSLAHSDESKFTIGYNVQYSAVTCPGLLSDVKMYSMTAEEAANVTKPENAGEAAALVAKLQEKTPILDVAAHIQTPYTLETVWSTENGEKVTEFGANTVYTVTAVLTARRGYEFTQESVPETIQIGNQDVQVDASKVVISEDGSTMTVVHTFDSLQVYSVSAALGEACADMGTVSVSPETVKQGESAVFRATAKTGTSFAGWYADASCSGAPISTDAVYTKENITKDVTLYAKFTYRTAAVNAVPENASQGSVQITAGGKNIETGTQVAYGTAVTVRAVAAEGYRFIEWSGQAGQTPVKDSEYSFTMGLDPVNLTAKFEAVAPEHVAVTDITLNNDQLTFKSAGEEQKLTATVAPENASNKDVIWESSNPAVAVVKNGVVTAVADGKAVITAKSADNGEVKAQCSVTVRIVYEVTAGYAEGSSKAMGEVSVSSNSGAAGETLIFTASPKKGYRFTGWYDGSGADASKVSTENPYEMKVSEKVSLYAKFEAELADYTKVEEAKKKTESLVETKYTEKSWKALQDALNAVVYDKDVSEQKVVDGYAAAIEAAINALKEKKPSETTNNGSGNTANHNNSGSSTNNNSGSTANHTSGNGQSVGTKTGDGANAALWTAMLILSFGIVYAAGMKRRKSGRHQ